MFRQTIHGECQCACCGITSSKEDVGDLVADKLAICNWRDRNPPVNRHLPFQVKMKAYRL